MRMCALCRRENRARFVGVSEWDDNLVARLSQERSGWSRGAKNPKGILIVRSTMEQTSRITPQGFQIYPVLPNSIKIYTSIDGWLTAMAINHILTIYTY